MRRMTLTASVPFRALVLLAALGAGNCFSGGIDAAKTLLPVPVGPKVPTSSIRLDMGSVIATYLTTVKLKVLVTQGNASSVPIAGVTATFSIDGTVVGSGKTGPDGVAQVDYYIADSLLAGIHVVEAEINPTSRIKGQLTVLRNAPTFAFEALLPGTTVVEEGQTVSLRGHLYRMGSNGNKAISGKKVGFKVAGKEVATDTTDANGLFQKKYTVAHGSPATITFSATFDGDDHTLAGESDGIVVHAKAPAGLQAPSDSATPKSSIVDLAAALPKTGGNPAKDILHDAPTAAVLPVLEMSNVIGTYQTAVSLKGLLKGSSTNAPMSGAVLTFKVDGAAVGQVKTQADGTAKLDYPIAESMPEGTHEISVELNPTTMAKGTLTILKGATKTKLEVVPGGTAEVEEGTSVTLRGHLRRETDLGDNGLAGRMVKLAVDGKTVGSDKTDATGLFERKYTVPFGASKILKVEALFDGDGKYLSNASNQAEIKTTPAKPKLPPAVITTDVLKASGVARLPPAVLTTETLKASGAVALPAGVITTTKLHASMEDGLPASVITTIKLHATMDFPFPPATMTTQALKATGLF